METENNKSNIIEISELNKWYGDFHALKNINMNVKEGEIIVVCGPSGSGKSTLIRCVNFLEKFQEGKYFSIWYRTNRRRTKNKKN